MRFSCAMRDKELYQQILEIASPRRVSDEELDLKGEVVTEHVELDAGAAVAALGNRSIQDDPGRRGAARDLS